MSRMAAIIKLFEWIWDEDNKVSENKMAVSEYNMADFKMAAIIKLSQNEWVKFLLCKMAESMMAEFKWLPSSSWMRMNEFESDWTSLSQSFVQHGWIQDGRIQDGRLAIIKLIRLN